MLVLNNISFEFGARYLYKDTSWHIKPNEKYGLIGANGTGKSTLLRIITGEYSLSGGELAGRKNLSIGFLNQDLLSYESENNILHVAMEAFEKENQLHDIIAEILIKLEHDHSESLLNKLHDAQTTYEALDGYNLQYKAEAILEGLGFSTHDLTRPLKEFSGGWRMRVMLAKILLTKPDLLLLDEPTNHLDLPSIQWIEQYLADYEGTIVIVSHDRYFLDKVVDKTVEIANEEITVYSGNYSYYFEEKKLRQDMQHSQFKNQEKYIKEQEKLIDRFRAKASKAKMAQSRIKALERMDRIEDVEDNSAEIKINFNFATQPGKVIATLDIKDKDYGSLPIFHNTHATIERGDKIALIGANGKGKSTLLRMIDGGEKFEGTNQLGYNVIKSFYAQHQLESLNLKNDLLTELQHAAPDESDTSLRTLLGAFLFHGDDVFKKIKVLSGGEKSRVALAKTMLTKANFLLLDEPTNHLDMQSVNVLIQVLNKYQGSFILVSHDRYFFSRVANKIWWIENHEIKEYPGTYAEYEEWVLNRKNPGKPKDIPKPEEKKPAKLNETQTKSPDKEKKKHQLKLSNEVKQLEQKIAELDKEKAGLLIELSEPEIYSNTGKMKLIQQHLKNVEDELVQINAQWEMQYSLLMEASE